MDNLSHKDNFLDDLKEARFENIEFFDRTDEVMPSSRRIAYYGHLFFPFTLILSRLKMISKNLHENSICMILQKKTFNRFTLYGVFVAEKQESSH